MQALDWAVQVLVPIVVALLGSSWINDFLASRRQGKTNNDELMSAIKRIDGKVEENEKTYLKDKAEQQRLTILRFDDELRQDIGHSYEYYEVILKTISEYEKYCRTNPDFRNHQAVAAIKHIMDSYDECHKNNSFL